VPYKNPESELWAFLTGLPAWVEEALWNGHPSSTADIRTYAEYVLSGRWEQITSDYENILRRIPSRWGKYRREKKRQAAEFARNWLLPSGKPGRPRLDALAEDGQRLRLAGKSWAQIAMELNKKYGAGTTNGDAIRNLLASRTRKTKPKET
jgi:hypothetical protein